MPKTNRWIIAVMLLMLVVCTAFRIVWIAILHPDIPGNSPLLSWYGLGMLLDLKFIAIAGLVLWLLGHIPGLHYFKSHRGKHTGLLVVAVMLLICFVGLAGDFVSLAGYKSHLTTKILGEWLSPNAKTKEIWRPMPVFPLFIGIGLGTWIGYLLMTSLHKFIQKEKTRKESSRRLFAEILFVTALLLLILANTFFHWAPSENDTQNIIVDNAAQSLFGAKKMAP